MDRARARWARWVCGPDAGARRFWTAVDGVVAGVFVYCLFSAVRAVYQMARINRALARLDRLGPHDRHMALRVLGEAIEAHRAFSLTALLRCLGWTPSRSTMKPPPRPLAPASTRATSP
jgi:hypothetical protein